MARRVRFIGDAHKRIREDYLRILRFFRLTAEFAEGPADAKGLAACVRERAGLSILSAERVRGELLRLLAAPRGAEIAALMQDYGLLPAVLGAAPRPTLLARLAAIEAALGLAPDPVLRLAALAAEIPEDAERLRDRLRLSNGDTAKLTRAAGRSAGIGPPSPEARARAWLYRHGQLAYRERVLLDWARSRDAPDSAAWGHRLGLPDRWQPPRFPLSGADLLAHGVPEGRRVGQLLRALEEWWIAGDFAADETALRARLGQLARDDVISAPHRTR
jgi:poly(A) polymerase